MGGHGLALVVLRPGHLHGHLAVLSGAAELLPQLLDHVRRKGREHEQQLLKIAAGEAVGVELVDHRHERGDGGVHLERVDVVRDLLDGLVDDGLVLLGNGLVRRRHLREVPHAVEEALAALHRVVGPGRNLFEVADEHDIKAHGVRAVGLDHIVGIDDVAEGLRHLHRRTQCLIAVLGNESVLLLLRGDVADVVRVLAENHAVARALGIGLLRVHDADVVQELMPEAGVEQVERGVLHAAVVPVHGAPVILRLVGDERLVVVRVHIAQEVPARPRPLRHGVGLALGGAAALRAFRVDPVGHLGDGALAVVGRLVALDLRQNERQLLLGNGHPAARRAVDQRNGLAPIALAGEHPVTQLVVDLLMAPALLDGILLHRGDGLLDGHAVEEAGVDHDARIVLEREGLLGDVAALDHLDDGDMECGGEVPVALVMARNAHDDAGAVAHQNVVGDEHRHDLAVGGVDDLDAVEAHAGLVLIELAALEVALAGGGLLIGGDLVPVLDKGLPLLEQRVLGRDDRVGHAEERIHTGGIDGDIVLGVGLEGDLRTGGAADPVALLGLDALDEVHIIQIVDQAVGVLRDAQHPLALFLADDLAAAALANTLDDLLVCQHALAARAPVDGHGGLVGQVMLEHLQEDPLRPLVVIGVGGVHHTVPVEAVAEHLELAGEVLDVLLRDDGGMDVVLDGKVLGRQAEGVKADGIEDVVALHPLLAADDVHCRKGARMADVQSGGGRVRELDEPVEFRSRVAGHGGVGLFLLPLVLPFFLNGCEIVLHDFLLLYFHSRFYFYAFILPRPASARR